MILVQAGWHRSSPAPGEVPEQHLGEHHLCTKSHQNKYPMSSEPIMRCANTAFKIRDFALFQVYLSADEWRPDLVGAAALAKCFGGRIGRRLGHDVPAPSNTPCTCTRMITKGPTSAHLKAMQIPLHCHCVINMLSWVTSTDS